MRTLTIAALAVAACGEPSPPGFSTGPGITTVPMSTSTSSTSGDTSSTGPADDSAGMDSAGESTTGLLRDVGATVDFGSAQPPGCKGKVDLLFLISRFVKYETEQASLLASFPGFVDTIQEKLADFDVHIMAANPEGYWPGWSCETQCAEDPQSCAEYGYKCNDLAFDVTSCDETLGAGLVFNAGAGAANRHCALYGGNRYIIQGEPEMDDALECIAKVGWSGSNAIGDAVIAAVKPAINADGGCNAGFLREDALLVIVMIAADGDGKSKSSPSEQYDAVVAAKGGDPDAIVVLHVTGREDTGEPHEPGCTYQPDHIIKLRQLGMMFPFYLEGDTCAPNYAPFFDAATDLIGEACGSFIPG